MNAYTVTITTTLTWTTRVDANEAEFAQEIAWDTFQADRDNYFTENSSTTINVAEVVE